MPFSESSSASDVRSVTLARWFHKRGISWTGTPSELVSELATEKLRDGSIAFPDADELANFVESRTVALSQLSVEASVQRPAGRPRIIRLQALGKTEPIHTTEEVRTAELPPVALEPSTVSDTASLPIGKHQQEQAQIFAKPPTQGEQTTVDAVPNEVSVAHASQPEVPDPSDRPIHLLGLSSGDHDIEGLGLHKLDETQEEEAVRARFLPAVVAVLFLVAVFIGIFAFSSGVFAGAPRTKPGSVDPRLSAQNRPANPADAGKPDLADGLLHDLSTKELLREASDTRLPSPQFELGMRYAEGRGVKQDKIAAYTWLVIARTNGSTKCDPMLQSLAAEFSPAEVQKVRLKIGQSFANGIGVAKDNVTAHTWISLAEVAGSAEATVLKKRLETKMTPAQIEEATTRTTAWLSRH